MMNKLLITRDSTSSIILVETFNYHIYKERKVLLFSIIYLILLDIICVLGLFLYLEIGIRAAVLSGFLLIGLIFSYFGIVGIKENYDDF